MPKTKKDKSRKHKVDEYKTVKQIENHLKKQQVMNEQQSGQPVQQQGIPPIKQVPVWHSQDKIEMIGVEFESIFNYINNAYAAVQSVMNRNLLSGIIRIRFEKLNADQTEYVPMTEAEEAPLQKEFQTLIDRAKVQSQQPVPQTSPSEGEIAPVVPLTPVAEAPAKSDLSEAPSE